MKKITELTVEEKLGQTLIVGFYGTEINDSIRLYINKYKVGGFILFRRNIESIKQVKKLISDIKLENKKAGNIPLFICVDQEGGRVNRLPKEIKKFPSANKIFKENTLEESRRVYEDMADILVDCGFNLNFAPVLDIKTMEDMHAIGDRAISDNIDDVIRYGKEFVKGLQNKNIISVAKHFPGHGLTKVDTHRLLPVVKQKEEEIIKHIMPFRKSGSEVILTSHIILKNIDKKDTVSLSKIVIDKYLSDYKGLLITDDLMMKGLCIKYLFKIPIRKAIIAGNNMILLCKKDKLKIRAIKKYIKIGLPEDILNDRVEKILNLKEKYKIK